MQGPDRSIVPEPERVPDLAPVEEVHGMRVQHIAATRNGEPVLRSPISWKVRACIDKANKRKEAHARVPLAVLTQVRDILDSVEKVLVSGGDERSTMEEIDAHVRKLRRTMDQ